MFQKIKDHCDQLVKNFEMIPEDRKRILNTLTSYVQTKFDSNQPIQLLFVCTHNSRRSHLGQVWSAVAAAYYHIENIQTFSGGTDATAFNPNAINALHLTGFEIKTEKDGLNPHYKVYFTPDLHTKCFSKIYNDPENPTSNFAAIMTCSDADENCPFITGADKRISLTYDDPKAFDGTPRQEEKYMERSNQIALECLYVFSKVLKAKS